MFLIIEFSTGALCQNISDSITFLEVDQKWIDKVEYQYFKHESNIPLKGLNYIDHNMELLNYNTSIKLQYTSITDLYIKKYLKYKWLPKIIGLANYYFPLFEYKLKEYGLPDDLKYLAIVESNVNPRAHSHVGASGLWQFMPATGKEYGLNKDKYVNLWYDPVASTESACKYLKYLFSLYKDWNLALSAYNCGPGNVNKAIRKAGTKEYWSVRKYLPKETKAYVPSFHAVKYVANFLPEHGKLIHEMKFSFADIKEVYSEEETTLKKLSYAYGIDYEILSFINPQFIQEIVPKGSFFYIIE